MVKNKKTTPRPCVMYGTLMRFGEVINGINFPASAAKLVFNNTKKNIREGEIIPIFVEWDKTKCVGNIVDINLEYNTLKYTAVLYEKPNRGFIVPAITNLLFDGRIVNFEGSFIQY